MPNRVQRTRTFLFLVAGICIVTSALATDEAPIDLAEAKRCFEEARTASELDAGRLWGIEVYGPILLVDRASRFIVANQLDASGSLVEANGETIPRDRFLKDIWGMEFDPGTNVLDVQIGRLRRKLDRHGPPLIETVRGEGYRLVRAG